MAPGRPVARRAVTNENDENAVTTRVTRAKAATLAGQTESTLGAMKKPLQAKKSGMKLQSNNEAAGVRKRTALGDLSNVNKADIGITKDVKKTVAAVGALAKAAAPTGIQKSARTNSARSTIAPKDKNGAGQELKRPASVIGGNAQKRRSTTTNPSSASRHTADDDLPAEENVEPAQNQAVTVKITESVKVTSRAPDGSETEKEVVREENFYQPSLLAELGAKTETIIEAMDQEDEGDPLMVSEYVYEILDYMKELEETTCPNPGYMEHQKHLEWRMRGVLVDWLLEVHTRFRLLPETLYLTINIIDRFLSCKVVQLERLQLVGVTAMFIASKYEEVLSPHIGNFRHVADDGFTDEEILSAERYILATLNYDLSYPNPMHFMRRISKADGYDIQTRTLAKYLLEISLLDHRLMEFKPSLGAAAAMHLARVILDKGNWDELLVHYSGYTEDDIQPAVRKMVRYLREPIVHQAFYKKYAGRKFWKASLNARAWAKQWYEQNGTVEDARIG